MVAYLVGLKWQLLRNSLRRSTAQLVGLILGALYGLSVLVIALIGLIVLRFTPASADASTAIIVCGSVVTLGWAIVPIMLFGVDETLDPARFATFAVPRRQLVLGLLLSSFVSVPAAITAILGLATVITWSQSLLAVPVALVASAVAVLTCITLSRVTATAFAAMSRNRRSKDLLSVLALLILLAISSTSSSIVQRLSTPGLLDSVADVLGWTPLGLAWSAPAALVEGAVGSGLLRLALAVVFLMLALLAWDRLLKDRLENPGGASGAGATGRNTGLGWFGLLPGTPTGAVAARSLTYWRRDPRYVKLVVMFLGLPLALVVPALATGSPGASLAMAPAVGYLLGWILHNDIAYDGSALWLHVATGVSGRADRLGRLLPTAVVAAVLLPGYATLGCALTGRWELWPTILGIGLGFLLTGFGVANVASALQPYAVPGPGESPYSAPPGSAMLGLVVQMVCGGVILLINLPVLIIGILAAQSFAWLGWLCLALAIVIGSLVAEFGTRWGSRLYERRAPELLARLRTT